MKFTPKKLNLYLLKNLPSAYFSGVRVTNINNEACSVKIRHGWFNQNPFRSLYFAVQNMGAELTTGALIMQSIQKSDARISMLVLHQKSQFTKKAVGTINFHCDQGLFIEEKVKEAEMKDEGVVFWVQSKGVDETGDVVGIYDFKWTLKKRK